MSGGLLLRNGEAVAADLRVHPQTVRYRMGQVRQRFGEHLDDPDTVGALVVALAARGPTPAGLRPAPPPGDDGPSGPAPSRRTASTGS